MLDDAKMVSTLTVLGIAVLAFAGAQPMRSGLGLCWLAFVTAILAPRINPYLAPLCPSIDSDPDYESAET